MDRFIETNATAKVENISNLKSNMDRFIGNPLILCISVKNI